MFRQIVARASKCILIQRSFNYYSSSKVDPKERSGAHAERLEAKYRLLNVVNDSDSAAFDMNTVNPVKISPDTETHSTSELDAFDREKRKRQRFPNDNNRKREVSSKSFTRKVDHYGTKEKSINARKDDKILRGNPSSSSSSSSRNGRNSINNEEEEYKISYKNGKPFIPPTEKSVNNQKRSFSDSSSFAPRKDFRDHKKQVQNSSSSHRSSKNTDFKKPSKTKNHQFKNRQSSMNHFEKPKSKRFNNSKFHEERPEDQFNVDIEKWKKIADSVKSKKATSENSSAALSSIVVDKDGAKELELELMENGDGNPVIQSTDENQVVQDQQSVYKNHFFKVRNSLKIRDGRTFIYGKECAYWKLKQYLKNHKSRIYACYICNSKINSTVLGDDSKDRLKRISEMCGKFEIPMFYVTKNALDKVAENRPHQGVALECDSWSLPRMTLLEHNAMEKKVNLLMERDNVIVSSKSVSYQGRFPFLVIANGLKDPQNVGALMRSGYFLNMDAMIFNELSHSLPETIHRASGCASIVGDRFFRVSGMQKLLMDAKEKGWFILGTELGGDPSKLITTSQIMDSLLHNSNSTLPWKNKPLILLLGSEGSGLPENLATLCDLNIIIPMAKAAQPDDEIPLDSMNVSAAGSILMNLLKECQRAYDLCDSTTTDDKEKFDNNSCSGNNELDDTRKE